MLTRIEGNTNTNTYNRNECVRSMQYIVCRYCCYSSAIFVVAAGEPIFGIKTTITTHFRTPGKAFLCKSTVVIERG